MKVSEIHLPSGHVALIDNADWPLVQRFRWFASVGKRRTYVVRNDRKSDPPGYPCKLHRLLLEAGPGQIVDHVNHDGLDNRRANLRLCSLPQNGANARRSIANTSGYRGVNWLESRGKWRATIMINGKSLHLGLYSDAWEAAQAYNEAAIQQWGGFAYVNTRIVTELLGGRSVPTHTARRAA